MLIQCALAQISATGGTGIPHGHSVSRGIKTEGDVNALQVKAKAIAEKSSRLPNEAWQCINEVTGHQPVLATAGEALKLLSES